MWCVALQIYEPNLIVFVLGYGVSLSLIYATIYSFILLIRTRCDALERPEEYLKERKRQNDVFVWEWIGQRALQAAKATKGPGGEGGGEGDGEVWRRSCKATVTFVLHTANRFLQGASFVGWTGGFVGETGGSGGAKGAGGGAGGATAEIGDAKGSRRRLLADRAEEDMEMLVLGGLMFMFISVLFVIQIRRYLYGHDAGGWGG